jgi:probable rRNA maturation factor
MHTITIQFAVDKTLAPKKTLIKKWAEFVLKNKTETAEITIRIVDIPEMTQLNSKYRKKSGATNVLSFPFHLTEEIDLDMPLLGDIVICAEVVNREAKEQQKTQEAHWAHMIIHGVFHLLGYDHETDDEAEIMEGLEIDMMHSLGFENPYAIGEKRNHD